MKRQMVFYFVLLFFIIISSHANQPPQKQDSLRYSKQDTTANKSIAQGWIQENKENILISVSGSIVGAILLRLATAPILRAYRKLKLKFGILQKSKSEEDRYIDFIINENEKLTFHGFETQVRVPILLWNIYVPLRVDAQGAGIRGMESDGSEPENHLRNISVEEAVKISSDKNYDGLVILGDPGSGKTTLLKYFLLCFAKKEAAQRLNLPADLLPVMIPLRSVDLSQTFLQSICGQFKGYDLRLNEEFFINRFDRGKAIILLDGLDEVADDEARKQMCQWIHKARTRFNKCPFIITSRYAGYRGGVRLPGTYMELHMLVFTRQEIRRFVHSWYNAVETALHEDTNQWRTRAQKEADELCGRIESNENYLRLAINPLMLQLIALVHYDYKTVPDRRVELYEKCVDLLLQKWDEAKGLKALLSAKEARQVLQPLALWMHSVKDRRQESKENILKFVEPHVQRVKPGVDSEKFLTSMRDRCGVLVGYGTEKYGFQHHSFQEYLTAEEIRNSGKNDILVDHFDEAWWREPTLLSLGLSNPSIFEPFIKKFMNSEKNNGSAADFLVKCVKEATGKTEEPLAAVLHDQKVEWARRYNALLCLEAINSDLAKEAVNRALNDKKPEIASKARELLIHWGRLRTETVAQKDITTGLVKSFYNPLEENAEYILIAGGKYVVGESKKEARIDTFYMAKFPVTNKLYGLFIKATKYRKPSYWDDRRFNGEIQPVVGVSWDDAMEYCGWLTKHTKSGYKFYLPSEEEWEWAAGGGKREYPWGVKKPNKSLANYGGNVGQTTPVGSYPEGATPEGLMDMAGNVWEWTNSIYDKNEDRKVLRGGSFNYGSENLACSIRDRYHRLNRWDNLGFRVACYPQSGNLNV